MVKLDANLLRYLEADDFRVLTAVEMGMKNHQLVPGSLVNSIAGLRGGGTSKILHNLTRDKLLVYERGKKYDGYRLTYLGYDYLALHVLSRRGAVTRFGNQIGVGKESDVYVAVNDDEERFAVKLHRLGRTCFRKVTEKRDYHVGKIHNWIYLSRLAAAREYSFLKALYDRKFPVPKPVDTNRHVIVMELINGTLLNHIAEIEDKSTLYDSLMNLILSLANDYGVVHGDFNEFNIMIHNETSEPILIDFPQMISTSHKMAKEYFHRDVECIVNIFKKKYHYVSEEIPDFDKDVIINETDESIVKTLSKELNEYDLTIGQSGENDNDVAEEDFQSKDDYLEETQKNEETQNSKDQENIEKVNNWKASNVQEEEIIDQKETIEAEKFSKPERQTKESFSSDETDLKSETASVACSQATYSVAGSTFTTDEIRSKLKKEFANRLRREELKKASKSVKGEDSAVRRQRRDNHLRIKEDVEFATSDWVVN